MTWDNYTPAPSDLHYILTIQFQKAPGSVGYSTITGSWRPGAGHTRHAVYEALLADARRGAGVRESVTVFFSLEPDDLGRLIVTAPESTEARR